MDDMELTRRMKGVPDSNVNVQESKDENDHIRTNGSQGVEAYDQATGKNQLARYIRFPPILGFIANLQLSWVSIAVSFQASLLNGGPTALVYGTILAWAGSVAIAASLGEMASITPTVGAQYRWCGLYAPPRVMSPAFWSLIQGWITVFAWIANTVTPAFLLGTQIQGLVILNVPSYVPQQWHGTLLGWAVLAIPVLCNIYATQILEPLEIVGAVTNILFYIVITLTLAILAPRSSASFVFTTTITGLSGWQSTGVQWCIGLLPPVFALSAFDGVLHMADEVKDAPRKVPWSMVLGVAVNGLFALAFMITVLFTLGNLEAAQSTPTGYPIIEVFVSATKSKGAATALMSLTIFNGVVSLFNGLASTTRLTWVFAKDHGLPFSGFLGYVHPTLRIPTNALGLVTIVMCLIQIINIASTTALEAILSLGVLGLYLSYILPILFFLLTKLRGGDIPEAPFRMGPMLGYAVNIFALCYGIFIAIWLPFPSFVPVTWENMNYAGPVLGVVILFAIGDWFVTGRKRFVVPTQKHDLY